MQRRSGVPTAERGVRGVASFSRRLRCRLRGGEAEDPAAPSVEDKGGLDGPGTPPFGEVTAPEREDAPLVRGVPQTDPIGIVPRTTFAFCSRGKTESGNAPPISPSMGNSGSQRPGRRQKGRGEGRRTPTPGEANWSSAELCSVSRTEFEDAASVTGARKGRLLKAGIVNGVIHQKKNERMLKPVRWVFGILLEFLREFCREDT